jgi:hypothetical protein
MLQNKLKAIPHKDCLKATPHKDRLTALLHIYLNIFRHLAQKFLDIRQPKPKGNGFGTTAVNIAAEYACEISIQSDEKSCYISVQQSLCGVTLNLPNYHFHKNLIKKYRFNYFLLLKSPKHDKKLHINSISPKKFIY